jgi:hypothetical protein
LGAWVARLIALIVNVGPHPPQRLYSPPSIPSQRIRYELVHLIIFRWLALRLDMSRNRPLSAPSQNVGVPHAQPASLISAGCFLFVKGDCIAHQVNIVSSLSTREGKT